MGSSAIDVESVVVGTDLVIELEGELDMASVREAGLALEPRLALGPYERVLVHGRDLRFCDSSGLQFLLRLAPRLRARGGVQLLSESPQLHRAVELAGLREVLPTSAA
jgi:anti-anti-sigma factor